VGALIYLVQRVKVRDRVLLARQGTDGSVHPDFQDQGIMSAIRAFMIKEFPDTFDLYIGAASRHEAMHALTRRAGSDDFGNGVTRFVLPLGVPSALRAFRLRLGRSPRKLARDAAALARWAVDRARRDRNADSSSPWTIETVERFDARTDALWERASAPFDFAIERRAAYLNWRYADPRGGPFTIRTAEAGGEVLGYAVTRMLRGRAFLADLLALPERHDVVSGLVRDAAARAQAAGAGELECWLPARHPYRRALDDAGFLDKRHQRVAHRALSPGTDLSFLQEPRSALHFTIGDLDIV
jgi:hypothetical protein